VYDAGRSGPARTERPSPVPISRQLTFHQDRHSADLPIPDPAPALAELAERVREYWAPGRAREIRNDVLFPLAGSARDALHGDEPAYQKAFEADRAAARRAEKAALAGLQHHAEAQARPILGT
jgi:hypothetical protein